MQLNSKFSNAMQQKKPICIALNYASWIGKSENNTSFAYAKSAKKTVWAFNSEALIDITNHQ